MDDAFSTLFVAMMGERAERLRVQLAEIGGNLDEVREGLSVAHKSLDWSRGTLELVDARTPRPVHHVNAPLADTSIAYSPFAQ